ncbi:hypothetical protein EJ063_09135 [Vibrio aquaticus]|uniref:YcxB family protein n=1 Tax=Vibrio aquaticus TaxID=2496559 RepID=A0A3S0QDC3_9VIBR|nr:protein YgfX [Vibrio aquaticus]RTZ15937.1 hypothetical protein EJ063_09135 [Vibrio aquaticus]
MPLWLIKLSPTTSAKCVRLFLTQSYFARLANIFLFILASSLVLLSELPLAAAIPLIAIVFQLSIHQGVFAQALVGDVQFHSCSSYEFGDERYSIKTVLFLLMPVVLVIVTQDNRRVLLWRDSLPDDQYRQLVVMLKREQ